MRVARQNLLSAPALFTERPYLLTEILEKKIVRTVPISDLAFWRRVQTRCECQRGAFYYEEFAIDKNVVELFACGVCKGWALAVLK